MRAGAVMSRKVATVGPESALVEAIRLMRSTGHGALPVVDEDGGLLGMVSDVVILNRCLPEYVHEVGDLYSAPDFAPFDERVQELAMALVQDAMSTDGPTAEEDTPLAEIAALMTTQHVRHVPVLRTGRLVGIVGVQDVIDGIAACIIEGEPAP
jgi:CBS domain-containing protein